RSKMTLSRRRPNPPRLFPKNGCFKVSKFRIKTGRVSAEGGAMSEKQAQPARSDKDEQAKSEKDKQGRSDKEKQARSEKDMFYRSRMFPDVRSALKYQQKSIEQIKTTCLVGTDANVLLMPYQIDRVSLDEIVKVYNSLNKEKRLIIPAQAAREFLS